ncbi:MAG: phosphoribosylamine--glycine ligase [Azoarcus sp.]|jgi:phosphoribosylamine--glycine ligase|nr:phosphoribosylamine--glycine ligase [Azoarcus sp.]
MKVLVIGSGGREHALAWKLAQSPKVTRVLVAPGNPGTAREPKLHNVAATAVDELIALAHEMEVAFTVVGPEAPLAAGMVDAFRAAGLAIFGPTRDAARLESSKDFAKRFLVRHHIPTAKYHTFANTTLAHSYVDSEGAPIVIKADGLAAGKGVVVAMTLAEAHQAIDAMLPADSADDDSGAQIVIEEFMHGEEASFIVMADGRNVLALATSQDHKRLADGDLGPNTGGMGAYSPAPVVTPEVHARVMREIILPTMRGMNEEGCPYTGFLYAGLMIDATGHPRVVEFNCRMGDPETQPIMMRLKTDLADLMIAALNGQLDRVEAEWDRRVALGVVLAAAGYPAKPEKGKIITGLVYDPSDDIHIFQAGTADNAGNIVTSGGRVLCVTALGDSVRAAQERAYETVATIHFEGMHYRRDIGHRALERKHAIVDNPKMA